MVGSWCMYILITCSLSHMQYQSRVVMDDETLFDVKKGLEFGQLIHLPSNLTFSSEFMIHLLVTDGHVRPFQHVRYVLVT